MKRKTVKEYVVWRIINLVRIATYQTLKSLDISLKNGYKLPKSFTEEAVE